MLKGQNSNRPKPGSQIRVDPIRKRKDIESIKKILASKPRDLALFTLGINSNLRASDLVRVMVGQVRDLKPGDELTLNEKKTGKPRRITLNKIVVQAIQGFLKERSCQDDAPLFLGQRGVLTVSSVHALVKSWCRAINLKGNYGSHTLRKTWGYHMHVTFGTDLPTLMEMFNHGSQKQTLSYLCVSPGEIKQVYLNEL